MTLQRRGKLSISKKPSGQPRDRRLGGSQIGPQPLRRRDTGNSRFWQKQLAGLSNLSSISVRPLDQSGPASIQGHDFAGDQAIWSAHCMTRHIALRPGRTPASDPFAPGCNFARLLAAPVHGQAFPAQVPDPHIEPNQAVRGLPKSLHLAVATQTFGTAFLHRRSHTSPGLLNKFLIL